MSRTRTLQMLLVVSATAWVLILGAMGGMIALHVFELPHPALVAQRVEYAHVDRRRPVLVHTAQGYVCCPPPPCCPRSVVTYVAPTPPTNPPKPRPSWLFLFTGVLAASALVTGLVSRRRLAPMRT